MPEYLDVLLALCDRIAVLCGGKISGVVNGRAATKEGIGLLMTKHERGGAVMKKEPFLKMSRREKISWQKGL